MSQEVDLSTPLTKEERAYLHMRGRHADVERADNLHGTSEQDAPFSVGDGTGPQVRSVLTGEQAAARREQLLAELAALDSTDETEDEESDDEDDVEPYDTWTVPQLDAELAKRKLAKGGSKDEKVRRLEEDDENNA